MNNNCYKIGIIGNGFVGNATLILQCEDIDILCYDINPDLCIPRGTIINDLLTYLVNKKMIKISTI